MKKALIIFDLDGTLTDSCPGIMNCVAHALRALGREVPSEAVLKSFVGPPLMTQFRDAIGMDDAEAEQAVRIFRERYAKSGVFENSVFAGVRELLERLTADGYTLSVATSKPMHMAKTVLEHFNIEGFFGFWQGASGDKGRADKSDILEAVIEGCGFSEARDRIVLIGDRKYDAMGARACKIGFFGAGWGYAPKGELEEYSPLGIASSPRELYGMINEHMGSASR